MKYFLPLLLACACTFSAHAQLVVHNITYTGTNTYPGPTTIDADTNVVVPSGANITYVATTSIRLGPGFSAVTGSTFHALLSNSTDVVPPSIPSGLIAT